MCAWDVVQGLSVNKKVNIDQKTTKCKMVLVLNL